LTPTVVSLACAAYTERTQPTGPLDVDRMFILADAIEDVGCSDSAILSHLRGSALHFRGCWALDLLLDKK
jgi:hypothetical protein